MDVLIDINPEFRCMICNRQSFDYLELVDLIECTFCMECYSPAQARRIPYDEMRRLCGLPDFPDLRLCAPSYPYTLDSLMRMRAGFFGRTRPNPYVQLRAPGDPGIVSTPWTSEELEYARRNYAVPVRYVFGVSEPGEPVPSCTPNWPLRIGDRVGFKSSNGFRQESVVVDIVGSGFSTEYRTEDPRFSARARRLSAYARVRDQIAALGLDIPDSPDDFALWTLPEDPFDPTVWTINSDPESDTRTPQERALPRPSSTPPMWAVNPGRSRRTRNRATDVRTPYR